jgi:hypothetical protein
MNNATKSNAITEAAARAIVGNEIIDSVLAESCEFTNRLIDDCFGVVEMSASAKIDHPDYDRVTVLYLVDKAELDECEGELDRLDYSDYTFVLS